jgi:predicted deacylase
MSDTLFEDYPINLTAVDISPYKAGNTGVDYITTFDSGAPGLHVMISAILHGNEISGAITLDHLLKRTSAPWPGN